MNHQYFDIQVTAVPCTRVLYKVKLAAFFIAWVASVFGANSRSNTCYAARVLNLSTTATLGTEESGRQRRFDCSFKTLLFFVVWVGNWGLVVL